MSAKATAIEADIDKVLAADWNERVGSVVPKTEDVALSNGAVKLDAVFVYADLADSSTLATKMPKKTAAKILRAYLASMTKLISHNGGSVRSFDGDRVMGVFVGDSKNSNAAICALNMHYVVSELLLPKARDRFKSVRDNNFDARHCAGIASGEVLIVRAGVRGSNDLVFVGEAPNVAAKLSDVRDGDNQSYITADVYGRLNASAKLSNSTEENMWDSVSRDIGDRTLGVYRSSWWRKP